MNINISQSALSKAVSTVVKGVDSGLAIPILGGILIKVEGGIAEFRSTNLDVSVACSKQVNMEEPGATVVSGKVLASIVKSLPDSAVSISTEGSMTVIKCGRAKYRLTSLSPDDFPEFPQYEAKADFGLPASTMLEMAKKVEKSVSKDKQRPILQGIQLTVGNDMLQMASTDSYRLTVCSTQLQGCPDEPVSVVVRANDLMDALSLASDSETVQLVTSGNIVSFEFGTTAYVCRRVEGGFPDWRKLMPASYGVQATVDTSLLDSALKRVRAIGSKNPLVRVDLAENYMGLTMTTASSDESHEELDVECDGTMAVGLNDKFLGDCIASMKGYDEVVMEATSEILPVVFRGYGDVSTNCLLMPVRM